MDIHLIGTGNVFSCRLNPCIVLDGRILIEVPNGAVKKLYNSINNIKVLSLCLISHFHADHIFDIPFLLLDKNLDPEYKLTFIGPKGLRQYICTLCATAYPTIQWDTVIANTVSEFIELEQTSTSIDHDSYTIYACQVVHGQELCYGYMISDQFGASFSYTGDCCICEGARWLAANSQLCCADMNCIVPSETHMGLENLIQLSYLTPNRQILAIHTPDGLPPVRSSDSSVYFPGDNVHYMLSPT